jgi:hypothetical protein
MRSSSDQPAGQGLLAGHFRSADVQTDCSMVRSTSRHWSNAPREIFQWRRYLDGLVFLRRT